MLLIINCCFTLLRIWVFVFAKVVSQRFTNKKGNNRLPYLSFPYPIRPTILTPLV